MRKLRLVERFVVTGGGNGVTLVGWLWGYLLDSICADTRPSRAPECGQEVSNRPWSGECFLLTKIPKNEEKRFPQETLILTNSPAGQVEKATTVPHPKTDLKQRFSFLLRDR